MSGKYKITVSEPWDFESEFGENLILGEVIDYKDINTIIFRSDTTLNFNDRFGDLLMLKPRYVGESLKDLKGTVNGALLLVEDYENQELDFLEMNSKFVLIGSMDKL